MVFYPFQDKKSLLGGRHCVKAHGHIQLCLLELHVARRVVRVGHGLACWQMTNLLYGRLPSRCAVMCLILAGYDHALLQIKNPLDGGYGWLNVLLIKRVTLRNQ